MEKNHGDQEIDMADKNSGGCSLSFLHWVRGFALSLGLKMPLEIWTGIGLIESICIAGR